MDKRKERRPPGRERTGREAPPDRPAGNRERRTEQPRIPRPALSEEQRRRADVLIAADEIELRIEKLVSGGDGLARYQGVPILVPDSAPGDRVRARITERRADYGRAEIRELLEPSPMRRRPPCPHFVDCGGCDMQHLQESDQLASKVSAAIETLSRLGRIDLNEGGLAEPTVHSASPWHYRVRAQFHTDRDDAGRTRIGFRRKGSHDIIAIKECPVLAPELEQALFELRGELGPDAPSRIDVALGSDGSWGVAPVIEGQPHGELELKLEEATLLFDARCFMQGHRELVDRLVELAIDGVEPGQVGTLFDLYGGVGLFSCTLGKRFEKVVLVEIERVAVHYAKKNLKRNGVKNGHVVQQRLETWIQHLPKGAAHVIVDPPRAGLPGHVRRTLLGNRPRRLTYVSCHPATLARDLQHLAEGFDIRKLDFIDLFPQTSHLETIVQLEAKELPPEKADERRS